MSEKNLPIKFFQKRQKDEQDTEGGGAKNMPKWLDPEQVVAKSVYIREILEVVSESLTEKVKRNNYVPSVVTLKINSDALAKTYRREIGNLFNVGSKLNTIGVNGEDEVLVKIDNQDDLRKIYEKISNADKQFPTHSTIVGISAITGIEEFRPQINIDPNEETILKVKLFNYGDNSLNKTVNNEFDKFCKINRLNYKSTSYSGNLNIYRINGITSDAFDELREFEGLQLVTEMPIYDITTDGIAEENTIPIKYPQAGVEYPIVGVLDTGIADIPHLNPTCSFLPTITFQNQFFITKINYFQLFSI